MRTLGGALGGQIAATLIAGHTIDALPAVTGFTQSFALATVFLRLAVGAAVLVPRATAVQPVELAAVAA